MGPNPEEAPTVVVREAISDSDLDAAAALTVAAYAEFREYFDPDDWLVYARTLEDVHTRTEQGRLLVASLSDAGPLVGTATLYLEPRPSSGHWRPDDAMMRFLAVAPTHRRKGVGRALVRDCQRRSVELGRRRLALQTESHMTAARQMYRHLGFHRDTEGDQKAAGFDLLAMAIELNGA